MLYTVILIVLIVLVLQSGQEWAFPHLCPSLWVKSAFHVCLRLEGQRHLLWGSIPTETHCVVTVGELQCGYNWREQPGLHRCLHPMYLLVTCILPSSHLPCWLRTSIPDSEFLQRTYGLLLVCKARLYFLQCLVAFLITARMCLMRDILGRKDFFLLRVEGIVVTAKISC